MSRGELDAMSDGDFIIAALSDGQWHSFAELIEASRLARGCSLLVHSQISALRRKGYAIEVSSSRVRLSATMAEPECPSA